MVISPAKMMIWSTQIIQIFETTNQSSSSALRLALACAGCQGIITGSGWALPSYNWTITGPLSLLGGSSHLLQPSSHITGPVFFSWCPWPSWTRVGRVRTKSSNGTIKGTPPPVAGRTHPTPSKILTRSACPDPLGPKWDSAHSPGWLLPSSLLLSQPAAYRFAVISLVFSVG